MVDSRRDGGAVERESTLAPAAGQNRSEIAPVESPPTQKIAVAENQDQRPEVRARSAKDATKAPAEPTTDRDEAGMRKAVPGDIMTRAEVALLLRCSEPHVIALVEREALPGFRLGRPWRFRRSEVLAWCERRALGRRSA